MLIECWSRKKLLHLVIREAPCILIFILLNLLLSSCTVSGAKLREPGSNDFGCHCMEYWTCITSGGAPYSYCGLSASSVCCFVSLNAAPVGILPFAERRRTCGIKGKDSKKEGEAEMAEWPWHAALLESAEDLYLCGGSLLDELWVMTAAHCVDEYVPYKPSNHSLKVRLGEYDVSTTSEPLKHVEYQVLRIVLHPQFDNSSLTNDIALLEISPVKRGPNIEAVCMPKKNEFRPGQTNKCYITGWGRKNEASEHSVVLKEIRVPLWHNAECQNALRLQFGSAYTLPSTALCAGEEGHDACDGDGGGPLVCEKGNHWYQVGVVSFGIGCGRRNMPGVYTKVESYMDWIEEVTGAHAHSDTPAAT